MSTEAVTKPLSKGLGVLDPITKPVSIAGEALGLPEPLAAGLGGAVAGNFLPGGSLPSGVAAGVTNKILGDKAEKKAEEEEAQRQKFNEDIFNLAKELTASTAQQDNTFFDTEKLQFQGNDARSSMLEALVTGISGRQANVQQQRFQPGLSQTRLALVQ